jgi:hypothetical protein
VERQSKPGPSRYDHGYDDQRHQNRLDRGRRDQSGEIGAYLQMRDTILPQAQNQLDELANQMSQALSNQTTSGTAVTSGSQSGYSVDVGSLLPGNTLQRTYTDSSSTQHIL